VHPALEVHTGLAVRVSLLALVIPTLLGCGGSTTEPARTDPQRVEAPPDEPAGGTDEASGTREGSAPAVPRRLEPPSTSSGSSTAATAPRGQRPTVPPPPVEPPTF
jgi:hypothetical protein